MIGWLVRKCDEVRAERREKDLVREDMVVCLSFVSGWVVVSTGRIEDEAIIFVRMSRPIASSIYLRHWFLV